MKRENTYKYPKVKIVKPFLWRCCLLCDNEYKKEIMYKIKDINGIGEDITISTNYICRECASSEKDAKEKYSINKNYF